MRDPLEDLVLQAFRAGPPAVVETTRDQLLRSVQYGARVFHRLRETYMAGNTSSAVGLLLERECRGEFTEGAVTGARLTQLRSELAALTERERNDLVQTLRSVLAQDGGQS